MTAGVELRDGASRVDKSSRIIILAYEEYKRDRKELKNRQINEVGCIPPKNNYLGRP